MVGLGIMIYNNFRGKVYGGSQVPFSSQTNPALQKQKFGYFYGTNIFIFMQTFLWNKYLFKNIYVYTWVVPKVRRQSPSYIFQ